MSGQANALSDEKLVEVIVPAYNVADFLPRCVDSLLGQTCRSIRIWLVDDGSTDGCPAICDNYALRDRRVVVIHKENGGLSSARNAALDKILSLAPIERGKFIACVDSDDWVEPDYVEFLLNLIEATGADVAQCGHYIDFSDTRGVEKDKDHSVRILSGENAIESLLRNGPYDVTAWNKLYRTQVLEDIRYPEGMSYEDTATAHLIAEQAGSVAVCMEPKYHYVQRYGSIANGTTWKDSKYDLVRAGDEMAAWVCARYPGLEGAALEKRVFVRLSTLAQMVNTCYSDKRRIREMRRFIVRGAGPLLADPKASKRDKLGTILVVPGFWLFRVVWKLYYAVRRRR